MKTLIYSLLVLLLVYSTVSAQQWAWWEEQTSGTTNYIWANSAVDDNVCWMGANGGVVLRTTNGGANWTNVGGGAIGTNGVYNIFAWDANLALCTTTPTPSATFVYRTTNGGATWTQVFTQAGGFIDNIWLTSETNGFMQGDPVGSRWSLWKTTDAGATWDSTGLYLAQVGPEAGYINAMYVNGSNMYFGTNNSKVYNSSNNGTSWIAQSMPLTNPWSIWFNSPSVGIAGGPPEGYVVTTNGGSTWSPMPMPPGSENTFSVTGYENQWYCLGDSSRIIGSSDNGGSWYTAYSAPAGLWSSNIVKARNGDVAWAGRDNGGITKGIDIGLPVELTAFTATANGKEVILNWTTATELNNQGFEIERSEDNISFNKIGFVPGFGTTTEPKSYSYSDQSVNSGTNYYRLKQVDFDGSYEYSDVVEVDFKAFNSYVLEQCYPNPFNPTTTIGFGLQNKSTVNITILNAIGEEVAVVLNEEREAGYHQVEFNAATLPSGVYFYQLKADSYIETKKMILMK
jgi:photosystem II stability/assembly factor-like uncharacterized protein